MSDSMANARGPALELNSHQVKDAIDSTQSFTKGATLNLARFGPISRMNPVRRRVAVSLKVDGVLAGIRAPSLAYMLNSRDSGWTGRRLT